MACPIPIRAGARTTLAALCILGAALAAPQAEPRYLWNGAPDDSQSGTLTGRIPPPAGFERAAVPAGGFAEWLRGLPLRPPETPVRLYDGRQKGSQDKHVAVVAIDTGTRNLQQCADAVMRLRAEYLLASGRAREIAFNDTSGKRMSYRGGASDRRAFDRYMIQVFSYAGTYSLEREMRPADLGGIQAGDVFIKGGFPGHAVLVTDIAENRATGEKRFLLLQSYMPAQDMHILTNPRSEDGTPWYRAPENDAELITPEWIFKPGALRRFKD
jgi:hypothetical protein